MDQYTLEERPNVLRGRIRELEAELVALRGELNTNGPGKLYKLTVVFDGVPADPPISETIDAIGKLIERPAHWLRVSGEQTTVDFECQFHYCIWVFQMLGNKKGIISIKVE